MSKPTTDYSKKAAEKAFVFPQDLCLAKTRKLPDGSKVMGVNVFTHCLIVGLIARELASRTPLWLQKKFIPAGYELLAASHDVGKAYPHFQEKIFQSLKIHLGIGEADKDQTAGWHPSVSKATLMELKLPKLVSEIVGRHHGYSTTTMYTSTDETYGGPEWHKLRCSILDKLKNELNIHKWTTISSSLQADYLSGLVCVADWIGSGPFFDAGFNNDKTKLNNMIKTAVDSSGFLPPDVKKGLSFDSVFPFTPKELQSKFYEEIKGPGVYILEAPMGEGKTEAALFAAYIAITVYGATGLYFALPTQLTSNKIYGRFNQFLRAILKPDSPHRHSLLLHSAASLVKTTMGEEGKPGGSWFDSRKRGLLAPFAVGTIDQALLSVLNAKHNFVRTFGLAGKVVIIDEVHSYDLYTGTILNKLVKNLKDLDCTVIILSATLTSSRRNELLNTKSASTQNGYPLISTSVQGETNSTKVGGVPNADVLLKLCRNHDDAIKEAADRAINGGQQVLFLENTVDEAIATYTTLKGEIGDSRLPIGLLHSRFIKKDRDAIEQEWVSYFGKEGSSSRSVSGRILVGTQILEQSLDIDADFMVTRLCPADLLFQRTGRLWRHPKNKRPQNTRREAWVVTPDYNEFLTKPKKLGKTVNVYAPYVLARTLEKLESMSASDKTVSMKIPKDIRPVLEDVYSFRPETAPMKSYQDTMKEHQKMLSTFASMKLSKYGKTIPDDGAFTRFSNEPRVDLLLVSSLTESTDYYSLTLLDNSVVNVYKNTAGIDRQKIKDSAAELMKNTVPVGVSKSPEASYSTMEFLKDYLYVGDKNEDPSVRIGLVHQNGEVTGVLGTPIDPKRTYRYSKEKGYS